MSFPLRTPATAQSPGALLKSARDIIRKDKGLNGDLDRLPLLTGKGSVLDIGYSSRDFLRFTDAARVSLPLPHCRFMYQYQELTPFTGLNQIVAP